MTVNTKSWTSTTSEFRLIPVPATLFAEDLQALAAALPSGQRLPTLELIMARGRRGQLDESSPNHVRYQLFGTATAGQPAVAALCRVSDQGNTAEETMYWLRVDPVTLRADMNRVFLLSCGFADMDSSERKELTTIVRNALHHEGLELVESVSGHWLIPLPKSPGFDFPALHEALGRDMADILPDTPAATVWKKRMTDIQIELHQSELMRKRREAGQQEINSVWFWGGGRAPQSGQKTFSLVITRDPVSHGLALLTGTPVSAQGDLTAADEPVLVDWLMTSADAAREGAGLEQGASQLLQSPAARKYGFRLLAGDGQTWEFNTRDRFKLWRKTVPLSRHFSGGSEGG